MQQIHALRGETVFPSMDYNYFSRSDTDGPVDTHKLVHQMHPRGAVVCNRYAGEQRMAVDQMSSTAMNHT